MLSAKLLLSKLHDGATWDPEGFHEPLAPVVCEHGVWTYSVEPPTDFFSLEALKRAWLDYYANRGPQPDIWLARQH